MVVSSMKQVLFTFSKYIRQKQLLCFKRNFSISNKCNLRILGIETSCDDTGCAILDETGKILGESLHSQHLVHLRYGGIIPPVARDLHRDHIEPVVRQALEGAHLDISDIDALAVTVRPGLPLSLKIGMIYGKHLCRKHNKPFIPIHHMQAHSLIVRKNQNVKFPFLVLLISGGHCLLALVRGVDDFVLLGESLDDAPGEAFDKTARRMRLLNLADFSHLTSGGQAIEKAASMAKNIGTFEFEMPLQKYRDCMFSFSGLKFKVLKHLLKKEQEHETEADETIPEIFDLCADFQMAVVSHLCKRTQRAMHYLENKQLIPEDCKALVVSGGVACNQFILRGLEKTATEMGFQIHYPEKKLCTDNGIMIAWNGIEKWRNGIDIITDLSTIDIESKSPLGISMMDDVLSSQIKCKWIKLQNLYADTR